MNVKKSSLFVLIILFIITSCNKKSTPVPAKHVDVYVAGTSYVSEVAQPCYWKNDTLVYLSSTLDGQALGIASQGRDVYIVGYTNSAISGHTVAAYWKNGIQTALTDGTIASFATSIAVSGSDIYAAGWIIKPTGYMAACYWKNGIITNLTDNSISSSAAAIAISGNDVYITGGTSPTINQSVATYWKNGVASYLTSANTYSNSYAIAVNGGDIYIAGELRASNSNFVATYWKNGKPVSLFSDTSNSYGYSISSNGADLFIAGQVFTKQGDITGVYWKNNTIEKIDQSYSLNSIKVNGLDVYTSGESRSPAIGQSGNAYWKNGETNPLLGLTDNDHIFITAINGLAIVTY
jgi:hypothetical protein